jgi:hypothetical protein
VTTPAAVLRQFAPRGVALPMTAWPARTLNQILTNFSFDYHAQTVT